MSLRGKKSKRIFIKSPDGTHEYWISPEMHELMDRNPSEVTDSYWVYALRMKGKYPQSTDRVGKWLIFIQDSEIDSWWEKIKQATENGLLGGSSKVATARLNPNAVDRDKKVIVVYTYDVEDEEDVMRVREELRKLGVAWKIPYKTDQATSAGKYRIRGDTRISSYYC